MPPPQPLCHAPCLALSRPAPLPLAALLLPSLHWHPCSCRRGTNPIRKAAWEAPCRSKREPDRTAVGPGRLEAAAVVPLQSSAPEKCWLVAVASVELYGKLAPQLPAGCVSELVLEPIAQLSSAPVLCFNPVATLDEARCLGTCYILSFLYNPLSPLL